MLRFLTAGESHGPKLTVILDGLPAGLPLVSEDIDRELAMRQLGYGRSERMQLEKDRSVLTAGVRGKRTIGSPICIEIENRVFEKQKAIWSDPLPPPVRIPRPGHADLAGWAKFEGADIRNIIERASARETAARVAAGAVAKKLLGTFAIQSGHKVRSIGSLDDPSDFDWNEATQCCTKPLNTSDPAVGKRWKERIDRAIQDGDSLGGQLECRFKNLPMGLGSHAQWDRRLDGRIAAAVMAIPGIKAVALGDGFNAHMASGASFRDPIRPSSDSEKIVSRDANRAGGVEGGMTNGEEVVVVAVMKPIPTIKAPGPSVDLETGEPTTARYERADTCAVHAAAVIAENVVAWEIAVCMVERFGGDTLEAMQAAYQRDAQGRRRWWRSE